MKESRRIVSLAVLSLCIFGVLFKTINTFADANKTSLQISPVVERISLDPGAHYKNNITITNPGNTPISFEMDVEPFQVSDIDYAPIYSVRNAYTQIENWISFEEYKDVLEPSEMTVVEYHIDVPEDAPGGGQYAVIFAKTNDSNTEKQSIHVSTGAGMVVVARVSGQTRISGSITGTKVPKFLLNPPVEVTASFENTGNIDAEPKMSLKLENYFSGSVIFDGNPDPSVKTVLPGTKRDLKISVENIPRLGIIKGTLNVEFADVNDAKTEHFTIIVCPIWFIAIIIIVVLLIIFRILAGKKQDRRTRANSKNDRGGSNQFNI